MHDFFKRGQRIKLEGAERPFFYTVILDASDSILFFKKTFECYQKEELLDAHNKDREERELRSYGKWGTSDILINIHGDNIPDASEMVEGDIREEIIYRFLQQLFLAMNIACPGSLNIGYAKLIQSNQANVEILELHIGPKNSLELRKSNPRLPKLFHHSIHCGFEVAEKNKWPTINYIPISQVWDWLTEREFFSLNVAHHPVEKALLALLATGDDNTVRDSIPVIAQALEALFSGGRDDIQKILKERLESVLGSPQQNKKWLNNFYNARSRIVHGNETILRKGVDWFSDYPDEEYSKYSEITDQAIGVLIAVLQDLVSTQARGYTFSNNIIVNRLQ